MKRSKKNQRRPLLRPCPVCSKPGEIPVSHGDNECPKFRDYSIQELLRKGWKQEGSLFVSPDDSGIKTPWKQAFVIHLRKLQSEARARIEAQEKAGKEVKRVNRRKSVTIIEKE